MDANRLDNLLICYQLFPPFLTKEEDHKGIIFSNLRPDLRELFYKYPYIMFVIVPDVHQHIEAKKHTYVIREDNILLSTIRRKRIVARLEEAGIVTRCDFDKQFSKLYDLYNTYQRDRSRSDYYMLCSDRLYTLASQCDNDLLDKFIRIYIQVEEKQTQKKYLTYLSIFEKESHIASFFKKSIQPMQMDIEYQHCEKLTREQNHAIECLMTYRSIIVYGEAGVGKSTFLKNVVPYFGNVLCMAFTGAATVRLKDILQGQSNVRTSTIASFTNSFKNQPTYDLYVIDEMSMVNLLDFYKILTSIHPKSRLLILGDPSQIPPISTSPTTKGNIFQQLIQSDYPHKYELTHVFRSTSHILKMCRIIRNRHVDDIKFIASPEVTLLFDDGQGSPDIIKLYKEDYRILCGTNKNCIHYNQLIKDHIEESVENQDVETPYIPLSGLKCRWKFSVGDIVMNRVNIQNKIPGDGVEIANGHIGVITSIIDLTEEEYRSNYVVVVKYISCDKDIGYVYKESGIYSDSDLRIEEYLRPGWAWTVHKSQGSEEDNVFVDASDFSYAPEKNRLLYTACSRAKKKLIIYSESISQLKSIIQSKDLEYYPGLINLLNA